MKKKETITYEDFDKVDIRVGTVLAVEDFPQARKPAFKLIIDFGSEIGMRKSSAQITHHYHPETLVGKQILAVVNFSPKQIGPFLSEVLVLGVSDADKTIILVVPEKKVENGQKLH